MGGGEAYDAILNSCEQSGGHDPICQANKPPEGFKLGVGALMYGHAKVSSLSTSNLMPEAPNRRRTRATVHLRPP